MTKIPGRLFTFGCSMTSYDWPTWADILGRQFEYFENWGDPGAGNTFIFDSIIECDHRNKFTTDDTVLIMWSGVARIDYYQQNRWSHLQGKFSKDDTTQPFSCPDGYEILSYPLFAASNQYLNSKKLQYKFFSWNKYELQSKAGIVYKDILSKIKEVKLTIKPKKIKQLVNFEEIKLLYDRLSGKDWPELDNILEKNYNTPSEEIDKEIEDFIFKIESDRYYQIAKKEIIDSHPLPIDHLDALKQIFPTVSIDEATVNWVLDINKKVQAGEYYSYNKHLPGIRL